MRYIYIISFFFITSVFSNPTNPTVIDGEATFTTEGNELTITTTSDRTIIDWDDFSVGIGEITNIVQPAIKSALLCRVSLANPSTILGTLKSNAGVILINSDGAYVGGNGNVSVNCYISSTLDVSDAEFLAGGDMTFSGSSTADIENQGLIKSNQGPVLLLGRHIINTRNIITLSSIATLGAGSSILFKSSDMKIDINPDLPNKNGVGIDNSGNILANQAEFKADGNLYTLGIRHTGSINAIVTNEGEGEILLIADKGETLLEGQGSLLAAGTNGAGGIICVLGETVTLLDQAEVSTSNDYGGGPIYIGGGFQGNNPAILNALNTTVGPDVVINSSAGIQGDAGNIVIWGIGTTDYKGTIKATGGAVQGNGALVEISGLIDLIYEGTVDTQARNGQDGSLLLDPENVSISDINFSKSLQMNDIIIKSTENLSFEIPYQLSPDGHSLTVITE